MTLKQLTTVLGGEAYYMDICNQTGCVIMEKIHTHEIPDYLLNTEVIVIYPSYNIKEQESYYTIYVVIER